MKYALCSLLLLALASCSHDDTPSKTASLAGEPEVAPPEIANPDGSSPQDPAATAACAAEFVREVVGAPSYGTQAGFGQSEFPQIVFGPPKGAGAAEGSLDVLSLGKRGEIVFRFASDIIDADGPDFVVFENPFYVSGDSSDIYAELGEVSVSENGVDWATFPCKQDAPPFTGCAGWNPVYARDEVSAANAHSSGGDAFDLGSLGVSRARFLRVRDVTGAGTGTTAGFDLDAAVALHVDCASGDD